MDFKSATIGNKTVVKVTLGNLTIYPRDVFVVDPTFITVDNMSQIVEIVVTSVIGGNAADVTKTVRLDEISMFDYGYITGSNIGERIYRFQIPQNYDYNSSRHAQVQFTQNGTGQFYIVDIWQDEAM